MTGQDHFIHFSPPLVGEEEINEVIDTLKSGWVTTGPKSKMFEKMFSEYVGSKESIGTNSCTHALQLALIGLGLKENEEVITTPFTFASSAHVILYQRAFPVFIDIEDKTYTIDPEKVEGFLKRCKFEKKIKKYINPETGRPVVGLLPVHYAGQACEMERLCELAERYNLFVVEDAAHAIGTEYKGKKIGSIGDVTCFSFYATKNITTGEGGMLTTVDGTLAEKLRVLSMYGIDDAREIWKRYTPGGSWDYDVRLLGLKCNLTDIQASLGIHQLKKLDSFIQRRSEYADIYDSEFRDFDGLTIPFVRKDSRHARHLYPLLIETGKFRIGRDQVIEDLGEKKIGTSVLFKPLHMHSFYRDTFHFSEGSFPVSESVFSRLINLPISPAADREDIYYVARTLKGILDKERL